MNKKSIIGIIVGSVVGVASIVITIFNGKKVKKKNKLKNHPTKYKPL